MSAMEVQLITNIRQPCLQNNSFLPFFRHNKGCRDNQLYQNSAKYRVSPIHIDKHRW